MHYNIAGAEAEVYRLRWMQLLTHLDYNSKTMCDTKPFTVCRSVYRTLCY